MPNSAPGDGKRSSGASSNRAGRSVRGRASMGAQLLMDRFVDATARNPQTDRAVPVPAAPEPPPDVYIEQQYNISDDEDGGTRIGDIYIPPPIPPYCSTESKGTRLIIKEIVNKNFKSYAGIVRLGPFHHRFTAIIGPNGSGKSNVIDSLLFVFGYRAAKIRCKKISTLLHNSAAHPNVSFCSVAVHFVLIEDLANGECIEMPDSDVTIERIAYRDNSSYYTINGKRAQFKEVSKTLKQHHVDLEHNRFLILQGEVESISMMKPRGQNENETGMLEYLEDIIGTSRYKQPLFKLNERVEMLTEERTEKLNRAKIAEREMSDIELPYKEAIEYLQKENEHIRAKNMRMQKVLSDKNKKLQQYTKEHEVVTSELTKHDEAVEAIKKEREAKEELVRLEQVEFNKLRKQKEDLEGQLQSAKSKYTETHLTMTETNKRRNEDKAELKKLQTEIEDLRKIPLKNQNEILECEKKVAKLTKEKTLLETELQNNYSQLEEQTKPLIEKREKLGTELSAFREQVDEAHSQLTIAESKLALLMQAETEAVRKYETVKGSFEESKQQLDQKNAELEKVNESLPQIKNDLNSLVKELQKCKTDEQQLSGQLMTLKAEIADRVETFSSARSNNKVLDFLMRQKRDGSLPGVLGRLGDLGAIDAKYDVAISTCCGRLDNIVADTVSTGTMCIQALKQHSIGKATFIALEKMEVYKSRMHPINTPENVHRIFDLIRVEDERILPAFYYSLFDTLVADHLEQARRIGYGAKRYRVVTLNGEMIEIAGTMSGGGKNKMRGKMGTQVQTKTSNNLGQSISQEALDDMQRKAAEIEANISFCQEEQGRLERAIQEQKNAVHNKETEQHKILIEIESLKHTLPSLEKQLNTLRKAKENIVTDADKVKKLEALIMEKKQKHVQCEKEAEKVQKKVAEINQTIDGIHGEKIKAFQTKIKSKTTDIKKLNDNISKLKAQVTTSERNFKKTEKQIEVINLNILKAQDDLTELNEQRKKFDEQTVELAEKLKHAEQAINDAKSSASGIQKEILALQKQENESNLQRVDIDKKVQSAAAKLAEINAQIPQLQEQLKRLQLQEIPGDKEASVEPLKTYTEEELAGYTLQDLQYSENALEEKLRTKPNLSVIQEYFNKKDAYLERIKVLEDVDMKRNEMREKFDEVSNRRSIEFFTGYKIINQKLKEMYQMITQGGDAELELSDSMDPFTEGITFSVRPPRKSWKMIANLSGGEKTLASLALVFALHYFKPSPLYFMDEIDAALDFRNVSIVAHYIKERTKNAQFIIISLRSNMFELADYLVGIYKVLDCTDSVCMKNFSEKSTNVVPAERNHQTLMTINDVATISTMHNQENVPPMPQTESITEPVAPHRDTTFAPVIESTALSPMLPNSQTEEATDQEMEVEVESVLEAGNDLFKKPLPPNTSLDF